MGKVDVKVYEKEIPDFNNLNRDEQKIEAIKIAKKNLIKEAREMD
jgi:hypothetical protein